MTKNRIRILTTCLAVACVLGPSVLAQDTHFKVYGGPAYVAPMGNSDVTFDTLHDTVEAEKKVGWNLGFEARFGHRMGIEVDYVHATQDVTFGGTTIGDTEFSPLTATLNFHLFHTKVVDFYVGPSYSFVNWGEIHLNTDGGNFFESTGLGTDSAHGWGASAGIDIGLGEHLAITGGLKYLNVDLKLSNGPAIKVDPLVARLGVAVRF